MSVADEQAIAKAADAMWAAFREAMEEDPPDGYVLTVQRGFGARTLYFGPFATLDEVEAWCKEHGIVAGVQPCYKTVDWMRK